MALALSFPPIRPSLSYLPDNSPASCPIRVEELRAYLAAAAEGAKALREDDLVFLRTAQIDDTRYWLWMLETRGGGITYATVMVEPDGSAWMAHHASWQARSSEEVLLADYHDA